MKEGIVSRLCVEHLGESPECIRRCAVGQGSYVYAVECAGERYIARCSDEPEAYRDTLLWLGRLQTIGVPVPRVVASGSREGCCYLLLTYLEGSDIGEVYRQLSRADKRTIAGEVAAIQRKVATISHPGVGHGWSWSDYIKEQLDRSEQRIVHNGYFDAQRVRQLRSEAERLSGYFASVQPRPYLDDISTKNLLVKDGHVSGVIDVDWMEVGDRLTFVALTNMALLNMELDTDYVSFLLEELQATEEERLAFLFYTLMFCVDFMGERGMVFLDKRIEVNDRVIARLNNIFDDLWSQWKARC